MKSVFSLIAGVLLLSLKSSAASNPIVDWNAATLDSIRIAKASPQIASRSLAMVHLSIYDAVNSIDRTHTAFRFQQAAAPGTSMEAAAAAAAYHVLTNLFPAQMERLNGTFNTALASVPEGVGKAAGLSLGETIAKAVLEWRANDGSTTAGTYIVSEEPGRWRPTAPGFGNALLPGWPNVTCFAVLKGNQFRPAGPPALTSSQYTFDFNITKMYGSINSTVRTADQTEIARFWLDGGGTITPPGHFNLVAQSVAASKGLTVPQAARMFALLNLAMADSGIAAWDAKYNTFPLWRPITAIQEADKDGNPETVADPNWTPLVPTPPHPEYVSGHATFSSSGAAILTGFFGSNAVPFSVTSDDLPGVTRSYQGFADAARESCMSRIYAGIHFMSAAVDGTSIGNGIAQYILRKYMLPVNGLAQFQASKTAAGKFETQVTGDRTEQFVVQASYDLQTWKSVATNSPPFVVQHPADSDPFRFFRAFRVE